MVLLAVVLVWAQVAFDYPEETAAKWAALKKAQQVERKKNTIPATNEYLGDLDFHYTVTGQASWRPVRVYNDGTKTIEIHLDKINKMEWWPHVVVGAPEIDVTVLSSLETTTPSTNATLVTGFSSKFSITIANAPTAMHAGPCKQSVPAGTLPG